VAVASIVVQLRDGDTVVHEFHRATSQPTAVGIRKMTDSAMGWLQAWSGQLSDEQWKVDAERARQAQAPSG
jgi:hypothetical protein